MLHSLISHFNELIHNIYKVMMFSIIQTFTSSIFQAIQVEKKPPVPRFPHPTSSKEDLEASTAMERTVSTSERLPLRERHLETELSRLDGERWSKTWKKKTYPVMFWCFDDFCHFFRWQEKDVEEVQI